MSVAPVAESCGGFSIGPMQLALPTRALREVVPLAALVAIPAAAPCVLGAIDLRGVLVPVVDLRVALGLVAAPAAHPSVLVVVHDGRVLGLAIDAASGIFVPEPPGLHAMSSVQGHAGLLAGSLRRADGGGLVSLLSVDALGRLGDIPMVADPEPQRQHFADDPLAARAAPAPAPAPATSASASAFSAEERSGSVMLFRCGETRLAVEAALVHRTIPDSTPEPSPVAGGICKGMVIFENRRIPAVDLAELLGLGSTPPSDIRQAFVLCIGEGRVACLISEVIDVARAAPDAEVALDRFAFARPDLIRGALLPAALGAAVLARTRQSSTRFLVIDPAGLLADPDLGLLSNIGIVDGPSSDATPAPAAAGPLDAGGRAVITYRLQGEAATPLSQVAEILPWTPDLAVHQPGNVMVGLALSRGRSVPILCLGALLGVPRPEATRDSCVLVVADGEHCTGFLVGALTGIESTDWEPRLPKHAWATRNPLARAMLSGAHAVIGAGERRRTLTMLDLQRIASILRGMLDAGGQPLAQHPRRATA
jgi:purine-binding chemotaxis protein CheW